MSIRLEQALARRRDIGTQEDYESWVYPLTHNRELWAWHNRQGFLFHSALQWRLEIRNIRGRTLATAYAATREDAAAWATMASGERI